MRSRKLKLPPIKKSPPLNPPPPKRTVTETTRRWLEIWDRVDRRCSDPVKAVCGRCGMVYVVEPLHPLHCPKEASPTNELPPTKIA